jgi:putative membrane protein
VSISRVVLVAFGLWAAAELVDGVHLAAGLTPLQRVGTLLVVALLFTIVDALAAGVRRAVRLVCEPLAVAIAAAVVLNAGLLWLTAALATAAGLGFAVSGFMAALLASLVLLAVLVLAAPARRG